MATIFEIEAESFSGLGSSNFRTASEAPASGGQLIRLPFSSEGGGVGTSGAVRHSLSAIGPGVIDLQLFYFDENDGQSPVTLRILDAANNQVFAESWSFNQNLGQPIAAPQTLTSRTISNVTIPENATLVIEGQASGTPQTGEYVRLDRLIVTKQDDDPDNTNPDARDDAITAGEDAAVNGSLFADNGAGADFDPDGDPFTVVRVNGQSGAVGQVLTLPSGAQIIVNANGTFTYNPNGQFENLDAGEQAPDSFTYSIRDDGGLEDSATVNVTVEGAHDEPPVVTTVQAENFSGLGLQSNFIAANEGAANGGRVIRLKFASEGGGINASGAVSHDLAGLGAGTYTIQLFYFDENDGQSPVTLRVLGAGQTQLFSESFAFNQNLDMQVPPYRT